MSKETHTTKPSPAAKLETVAAMDGATCSRLFRVQVIFDTVIYAKDEKAARQKVKYGTGEIDDMPVSVIAMPIESKSDLPAEWDTACCPWGDAPENMTIAEILSANA